MTYTAKKLKEDSPKIADSDFGCCCLLSGLGVMATLFGVAALLYVVGQIFGWID